MTSWASGDSLSPSVLNSKLASATTTAGYSTNTLSPESGSTVDFGSSTVVSAGTFHGAVSTATFTGTLVGPVSGNTWNPASGATVSIEGAVALTNTRITSLGAPSGVSDAATKAYVDSQVTAGVQAGLTAFRPLWSVFSAACALSAGSVGFITSTSSVSLADSVNSLLCPVANLVVCVTASSGSNVTVVFGPAEIGGYASLTTGGTYFVAVGSGITTTAPSATSSIVYSVGAARSATTLLFAPAYLGSNAT